MFSFSPSDAAVVRRTLAGQPQAFEVLVLRYQQQAHAVARAAGLRPPEVDDAVQEAFLQAFRDLASLREPQSFGGWFLHIVRHVSIKDLRRSEKASPAVPGVAVPAAAGPPAPSAAQEIEQKDFREYLWRKVAALPQGTREAIFLYYYQGESVRAVARSLGLSVSGAKRRLRSGREELRQKLWSGLEHQLRESMPSAKEWPAAGRRLALVVLASIPGAFAARAGAMAPHGGPDPIEALSRRVAGTLRTIERPVMLSALKKAAALAALALLLIYLGREGWMAWTTGRTSAAGSLPSPAGASTRAAATRPAVARIESPRSPAEEPAKVEEGQTTAVEEASTENLDDSANRGSVLVRVIWGDDRTPAPGVSGHIIPWGSPDLSIDERNFTSGPDGTVEVDHVFKGGAAVELDRGGRTDLKVEPGERREAIVEVPPGLNVQGVVVDRSGLPVGGARVWISFGGHLNWGTEVATTGADGAFHVRAISNAQYISAFAAGHLASDLRPLKGAVGATVEVRLVLNGVGGELNGMVSNERGEPVPHAKVMVGVEYPAYTLLDDGATGFSPPPFLGFTDDQGQFHADSLPPGKLRVAVRAPGFVPLEEVVDVPGGGGAEVELTLRRGATLSGCVRRPDGQPLTGAQVVIGDFRDFLSIKVFSGPGGNYQLRGLPAGELEAYAARPGVGKASTRLTVKEREFLRWNPVLAQDLEIRGRLIDENGSPLEGFVLVFEEEALGKGSRRATQKPIKTGPDGRFSLGELSDISYRIAVLESDAALPCGSLEEVRPGPDEVEIRVERGALASAYLSGRILDADGQPFPRAKVICYSAIRGYRVSFSEKGGEFRVGPLPPGRYRLEAQAQGRPSLALGEEEVKPGEERDMGTRNLEPPSRQ